MDVKYELIKRVLKCFFRWLFDLWKKTVSFGIRIQTSELT